MFREGIGMKERIESLIKMGWILQVEQGNSSTVHMKKDIFVMAGGEKQVIHSRKQISPNGENDGYVEYTR